MTILYVCGHNERERDRMAIHSMPSSTLRRHNNGLIRVCARPGTHIIHIGEPNNGRASTSIASNNTAKSVRCSLCVITFFLGVFGVHDSGAER